MLIYVKNTHADKEMNLSVKIELEAGNKNLKAPLNTVEDVVGKNRLELWMVCSKVDADIEWGDFKIVWETSEKP